MLWNIVNNTEIRVRRELKKSGSSGISACVANEYLADEDRYLAS